MTSSSQPILKIDVTHHGRSAVVRLIGAAHMDVSADLQDQLAELIVSPVERIVLDLSDLAFVSSAGLGTFIAAHQRCGRHGCVIRLAAPQARIRQLLELTCLDRILPIFATVEQALAAD